MNIDQIQLDLRLKLHSKRRTRNVHCNAWRSVCLFIRVKYRVSRAYRKTNVPKAALRAVVRSRLGKRTGNDWKYQVHLYLSRRSKATLAKVRVHEGNKGWGIRDGEEREWSWEKRRRRRTGHMQLQLWFSLLGSVPLSCREKRRRLRRTRTKGERQKRSCSRKMERTHEKRKRESTPKKRGKRSNWADAELA